MQTDIAEKMESLKVKEEKFALTIFMELKLDLAYEIYLLTSELTASLSDTDQSKTHVTALCDRAAEFMSILLNVPNNELMVQLAEKRKKMREYHPAFLPRGEEIAGVRIAEVGGEKSEETTEDTFKKKRAKYNFQRLARLALALEQRKIMTVVEDFRAKDQRDLQTRKIVYLNPDDMAKAECRLVIKDGRFLRPLFRNRLDEAQFMPYDTTEMVSHAGLGYGAYVINAQGEISIFNHYGDASKFVHASMNAGATAFAAGELKIVNGQLVEVTAYSGHYRPDINNVYLALKHLKDQGIDLREVKVWLFDVEEGISYTKQARGMHNPEYCCSAEDILSWGDSKKWKEEHVKMSDKSEAAILARPFAELRQAIGMMTARLRADLDLGEGSELAECTATLADIWLGEGSSQLIAAKKPEATRSEDAKEAQPLFETILHDLSELEGRVQHDVLKLNLLPSGEVELVDLARFASGKAVEDITSTANVIRQRLEKAADTYGKRSVVEKYSQQLDRMVKLITDAERHRKEQVAKKQAAKGAEIAGFGQQQKLPQPSPVKAKAVQYEDIFKLPEIGKEPSYSSFPLSSTPKASSPGKQEKDAQDKAKAAQYEDIFKLPEISKEPGYSSFPLFSTPKASSPGKQEKDAQEKEQSSSESSTSTSPK